ncbi:hypothetical protein SCA6_015393 [Theobroma cacao]
MAPANPIKEAVRSATASRWGKLEEGETSDGGGGGGSDGDRTRIQSHRVYLVWILSQQIKFDRNVVRPREILN